MHPPFPQDPSCYWRRISGLMRGETFSLKSYDRATLGGGGGGRRGKWSVKIGIVVITNRGRNFQHTTAIETGLSDFHKMVVTVLKASFDKQKPNVVNYRDYKNFRAETFRQELQTELADLDVECLTYASFQDTFLRVLDKHAPMKKRYIRANDSPFMNRTLRKAFMLRTRLKRIERLITGTLPVDSVIFALNYPVR